MGPLSLRLLILLLLATFCKYCVSSKILSIQFFSSRSHKNSYEPILIELAQRGHEVTVVNPEPSPIRNPPIPNLREIQGIDFISKMELMLNAFQFRLESQNLNPFEFLSEVQDKYCPQFYELESIQNILAQKFNIVMMEPFFNECVFGMLPHFNTTTIFMSPGETPFWDITGIGLINLPSFLPNYLTEFSNEMNFIQRVKNFIAQVKLAIYLKFFYYPKAEAIYRKYLGEQIPSIPEIQSQISLVMESSDLTFGYAKPTMPEVVTFGGLTCGPPKPLPTDIEKFVKDEPNGFIFFSLGSIVQPDQMPGKYRKMFLNVFAKLKQKVIWKWGADTMDGLPPNVIIRKWLPQQDILGHSNINLPMFGYQPWNADVAVNKGFAIMWDLPNLTEEFMLETIQEMLQNQSYKVAVQTLSELSKDRIVSQLDKAVFAIEYVIRHKGWPFKSVTRKLNWVQYFCLDVISFLVLIALSSIILFKILIKMVFKKVFFKVNDKKVQRTDAKKNK